MQESYISLEGHTKIWTEIESQHHLPYVYFFLPGYFRQTILGQASSAMKYSFLSYNRERENMSCSMGVHDYLFSFSGVDSDALSPRALKAATV